MGGTGVSVNPREYRHKVRIEQVNPNATGDANGFVDQTDNDNWIRFADRWASVFNKGGREVYRAQQVQADATHVVRMPFDRMLEKATTQMRIAHNGNRLNIASGPTDVVGDRRELEFICEESK